MKPQMIALAFTAAIVILGLEAIHAAENTLGYRIAYGTCRGGSEPPSCLDGFQDR